MFSLVGVLFLLCPWFSYGVFTRLRVLRRHPGILGLLSLLLFIALHHSVFSVLSYLSLVSMHLRPRGSVRMRRPEMMDGALSQSAGRLGASEHSEIDPTDGSVVHLVLASTPCGVCMETLYIDDLLVGKEDGIGYTIIVITPLL